jgi:hydroxyethylthiazole kinase-like uncharacterized protein yjeF
MLICTPKQMQSIDRRTIDECGIAGFDLMDRAGLAVAKFAHQMLSEISGKKTIIFCGKGNNGGDGFVVGRYLHLDGVDVWCYLLASKESYTGDAAAHLNLAMQAGVRMAYLTEENISSLKIQADLYIDAILGTGLRGIVHGLPADVIWMINQSKVPVLSIDVPSGLAGDIEPSCMNSKFAPCIVANKTVSIGLMKLDLVTYPGKYWSGKVEVADIGFPPEAIELENLWLIKSDLAEMRDLIPIHQPDDHKGDRGRVALVAGSVGMTGAATLSSLAAMRSGAGMVFLGAPSSLVDVLAVKMTEVMIKPLPESTDRSIGLKALTDIEGLTAWADILAIGPGLSQHIETTELVRNVVCNSPLPVVVDADGINAFIDNTHLFADCDSEVVITPHIGELSRLTNRSHKEIMGDRIGIAKQTAEIFKIIVVLKGDNTVIAHPDGRVSINSTGNPGMASAGSGDVLTGIISALISQGLSVWDAARLGVYLHGLAGDLGAKTLGPHCLIASDIINHLPDAFLQVSGACS